MNPASRLMLELGQLRHALPAKQFGLYCLAIATHGLSIARSRSLVPADRAMRGTVPFRVAGAEIRLPIDETERLLAGHDPTPTFGGAREMYASNVYLRGFKPGLRADTVLDLGSNRGLFLVLAAKALGATTLIGVEPTPYYAPVFAAIAAVNGIAPDRYTRYQKFIRARPSEDGVTLAEIMAGHQIERFNMVKCDIEGGEFETLLAPDAPLKAIDNLAMELHPTTGDLKRIVKALVDSGFKVAVRDHFNAPAEAAQGHYLYASRTDDLAG